MRISDWSSDVCSSDLHAPDYPALLRRIPRPPLALFVAGDPGLLWHPSVAMVGSRSPTAGGRDNARDFARAIAATGLGITSGLDRQSVVSGKSVSVRVDLGGRRIIKQKNLLHSSIHRSTSRTQHNL